MIVLGNIHAEIWNDPSGDINLSDGIINFFERNGLEIGYLEADLFDLLGIDMHYLAGAYLQNSTEENLRTVNVGIQRDMAAPKFIADSMLTRGIISPICVYEIDGKFKLAKGGQKIVACSLLEMRKHPILMIAREPMGRRIKSDAEFFEILRSLDSELQNAYVRIQRYDGVPVLHFLSRYPISDYFSPSDCIERMLHHKSYARGSIGIMGGAIYTGSKFNAIRATEPNIFADIDRFHSENASRFEDYFCTVYAREGMIIDDDQLWINGFSLDPPGRIGMRYSDLPGKIDGNRMIVRYNHPETSSEARMLCADLTTVR